jgi:hypothetical protein
MFAGLLLFIIGLIAVISCTKQEETLTKVSTTNGNNLNVI